MSDFTLQSPLWLWLWLPLACLGLWCWFDQARLAHATAALHLPAPRRRRQLLFHLIALSLMPIALSRPGWDPQPSEFEDASRDLIIALDVSRSMWANDRAPNRLENSRALLGTLLDDLSRSHNVGLILFAGSSNLIAPPTADRQFVRQAVLEATPERVATGGSSLETVLQMIADTLLTDPKRKGFQDILLLTDGETHGKSVTGALGQINAAQASLLVIGLGDSEAGSPIALPDGGRLYHVGAPVRSRQNSSVLRSIAGVVDTSLYLDAGTREIDLHAVYDGFLKNRSASQTRTGGPPQYGNRSTVFLLPALVLLLFSVLAPRWNPLRSATLTGLGLLAMLWPDPASAAEAAEPHLKAAASNHPQMRAIAYANLAILRLQSIPKIDPERAGEQAESLSEATRLLESALDYQANWPTVARNLEISRHRLALAQAILDEAAKEADNSNAESLPGENGEAMGDDWEWREDPSDDAETETDSSESPNGEGDMSERATHGPPLTPEDILEMETLNKRERAPIRRPVQDGVERDW